MESEIDANSARDRLLVQGAESYPEACAAIQEFEELILGECRTVLSRLSNAPGGIPLKPNKVKDWKKNGWLGVSVEIASGCTLYSGLFWNYDRKIPGWLIGYGADAQVLQPKELAKDIEEECARLLKIKQPRKVR